MKRPTRICLFLFATMLSLMLPAPALCRDLLFGTEPEPTSGKHAVLFNQTTLKENLLGWREIDNVPYVKGTTNPEQTFDLLLPQHKKRELVPLVIYIHGGGWYQGDKKLCPGRILVNFGYAVASINYRLTSDALFPAQIEDCKAALRYLREHAVKYGIDPNRIGVWGLSAGGHLAALLGTTSGASFGGSANPVYSVQSVVDWFGPADFTQFVDTSKLHPIAAKALNGLFGGSPAEHKQVAVAASPVTYANRDTPPFLIMHGNKDSIVPLSQSSELYEKLKSKGSDAQLVVVPDADHEMFGPDYVKQVIDFFDTHLKNL